MASSDMASYGMASSDPSTGLQMFASRPVGVFLTARVVVSPRPLLFP